MALSRLFAHPLVNEDIWLILMPDARQLILELSCTPESPVEVKKPTLTDKLQNYWNSIHQPNSLPTLRLGLTSKGKDLDPFWKPSVQAMSDLLLLPTKTDSLDLALNSLNGSVNSMEQKSWFSTKTTFLQNEKWSKKSLPFFTSFPADSTDLENIKLKSRKIQIYPEPALEKIWKAWMAAARYCYNQGISPQKQNRLSKLKLRNKILQSDLPEWVKNAPCHIRQNAILDAHRADSASRIRPVLSAMTGLLSLHLQHGTAMQRNVQRKWIRRIEEGDFSSTFLNFFPFYSLGARNWTIWGIVPSWNWEPLSSCSR